MTATASDLSALRSAARGGDRVAMLLLADLAEEGDPGWEDHAWVVLSCFGGRDLAPACPVGRSAYSPYLSVSCGARVWYWAGTARPDVRWSAPPEVRRAPSCPPGVRDVVLAACRLALSS
jgi:hypothetical protein